MAKRYLNNIVTTLLSVPIQISEFPNFFITDYQSYEIIRPILDLVRDLSCNYEVKGFVSMLYNFGQKI